MPDCSKGLKSRNPSRSGQAVAGGPRNNRDRCRNCEILESRIENARQTLREAKKELRKKIRELRNKRQKMNLILLTVIDICDEGTPKRNRRSASEEKKKTSAFEEDNITLADTIVSLVERYREETGELDSDFQDEDDE